MKRTITMLCCLLLAMVVITGCADSWQENPAKTKFFREREKLARLEAEVRASRLAITLHEVNKLVGNPVLIGKLNQVLITNGYPGLAREIPQPRPKVVKIVKEVVKEVTEKANKKKK